MSQGPTAKPGLERNLSNFQWHRETKMQVEATWCWNPGVPLERVWAEWAWFSAVA